MTVNMPSSFDLYAVWKVPNRTAPRKAPYFSVVSWKMPKHATSVKKYIYIYIYFFFDGEQVEYNRCT